MLDLGISCVGIAKIWFYMLCSDCLEAQLAGVAGRDVDQLSGRLGLISHGNPKPKLEYFGENGWVPHR